MAAPTSTTMKVVFQPDPNAPTLVEGTSPVPTPENGAYLVQVKGTSPCLGERTWEASFPDLFKSGAPRIRGTEGAGVVVGVPPGDSSFKTGDDVFYRTDAWIPGSLAEYTLVPVENLAHKPASLSWTDAAGTPLSALTAWQALFEHGVLDAAALGPNPDPAAREKNGKQRILVTGASGAVGSWALRFARAAGAAAVVGVCSGAKAADAKAFGATEVIDYTTTSADTWAAADASREVDEVFDCAGADLDKYWVAIKDGGVFLSVAGDPSGAKPAGSTKELRAAKWFLVQPRGADLARIAALIDANGWKPLIDSVVPFAQFAAAYDKVDSGRTKGKVIITVPE